jgi:hypothetical protein
MRYFALIFILSNAIAGAEAPELGCLDYDSYSAISRRINIFTGERRGDLCNTNSRFYRIVEALQFLRNLELDGPTAPYPYNQSILGTDFFSRIVKYSPTIGWGPSQQPLQPDLWGYAGNFSAYGYGYGGRRTAVSHSCTRAVAYAQIGGRTMYFCPDAFKNLDKTSVLFIAGTIIHESRHLEGRTGYKHVACNGHPQGCDSSAGFRGAFAAEMEAMAKIGVTATNVHPSLSYLARKLAFKYGRDNFKTPVAPELKMQSLVFLTDSRGMHLAYNHRFKSRAYEFLPPGKLIQAGDGIYIHAFKNQTLTPRITDAYEFQFAAPDDKQGQADHLTYKLYLEASPSVRATFKGAIYINDLGPGTRVMIWGDVIRMYSDERVIAELKLPSGHPLLFRTDDYGGGYTEKIYFHVLNDKDQLFKIEWEADKKGSIPSVTEVTNPYPGFTSVAKIQIREAYEKWEAGLYKWLNKKREVKDYPIPRPPIETRLYLLDKEGFLHYKDGDQFPYVSELQFYKFESMTSGYMVSPEHPGEFSADFF